MLDPHERAIYDYGGVSVAGCLGYDVLALTTTLNIKSRLVSVAGCLGYDVLGW